MLNIPEFELKMHQWILFSFFETLLAKSSRLHYH